MVQRLTLLALCLVIPQFAMPDAAVAAAVLGTNQPAEALTKARINSVLPAKERQPWLDSPARPAKHRAVDRAALEAERKDLATVPPLPAEGRAMIPLNHDASWYATPEALHVADVI